ncbi:fructosyl amine:oxygen oxidoreductase [Exophiala viscosa]|uniref:Fructosyl amine:oxygen oxidoreductase n=1 Tax=Exophiala viscosa TaxID=2486360 RepID=A0AAN6IGK2_9EURO|nr:fructosyl amine:oxygen oxidoreductase [Exophiala viscosa]
MSQLTHDSSILIIGGGTWGCGTALQLARRGFKNVTVLDVHPIPSPISAGNDVNKIVEEGSPSPEDDDESYVWNRMFQIATDAWRNDSIYKTFYHPTGFIMAGTTPQTAKEVEAYVKSCKSPIRRLTTATDFQQTMPEGILTGSFPNWKGFIREDGAGWVFARGALEAAYNEASRLGVCFITGDPKGKVERLLYSSSDVLGAVTADGTEHKADRTILCAGANSDRIFDFERQLRPTAWTLAHIQMTEEERRTWKNLPVLFNIERGFFIEPSEADGELKFVDEHPGYCNFMQDPKTGEERSIPFAKQQIPVEAEQRARRFLRESVPQIADRPFSFARICWDADTPDRQFLIDRHPRYSNLVVGVGGSGMGFMMMPAVSVQIADALEGTIEARLKKGFRWRPETAVARDWHDTQNRFGADGEVMDLQKVHRWTQVHKQAKLS